MPTALIILAAGQGSRMNSDLPKVLHKIAGTSLLAHAMGSADALMPQRCVVVAGHEAELVRAEALSLGVVDVVLQGEQLGTGHAVLQARDALSDFDGDALVLYGDTPFISPETLEKLAEARKDHAVVVLGFEAADAGRYGRLITDGTKLDRIVEFKDATSEERAVTLCNSGVIAADSKVLFDLLDAVKNDNAAGEYYLPDVVAIARERGLSAGFVTCDESETLGINTRAELARAEGIFQEMKRAEALENGVTLLAPETVFFASDTFIGRDAVIEQNVVFGPEVTIESGALIRAFSHLEGCHVSRGAIIGPYARLRPGAEISEDVRIGNFVEIKNATIAEGAKVNHLSYVGDASVGLRSNLGAGTVTCNYDGVMKHRTEIGNDVFIGSSTMLVAPVSVGNRAMTASGSVITTNVPAEALAIGRAKQVNKLGLAEKLFARLQAIKAKKSAGKS
ncbi:bifunctional UDP-N-acetylglucosamine diphosphorylase/glucosamine-1-phosphate N-acetyltransferase GlmU [Falsihalocynthiibacter arcticus]|uniref:Bifunctional protein GlmU n=1 Tax=Falsihalocynthiibacter arcticus TaxID=1579316 RepID=A0A126V4Z7_9RHOB|nr:bifunctional UDP-N-acetylglucosamine diphosphorylase/glucosamine-1-phosphate N-acetyltransferase GlmU [Falsihalocynthiibacter arcticus]AML53227.1 bifunctional N-acetylglucosamine-1-phosphate uridyltransferase/glucosamine-1-phosphate acetyltransferase [Falsihalocynthiibacter arcticus]